MVNSSLGLARARIGVRHEQGDGRALWSIGKRCQKFAPVTNHGFAFSRAGVKLQELRVQLRTAG